MKNIRNIFSVGVFIIVGCASWKSTLHTSGSYHTAIENAIYDFCNSSSLSKRDSVFSVGVKKFGEDIIGVSIIGSVNKFFPTPENKIGSKVPYFPTEYIEVNNKLFIWYDSSKSVTMDILSVLSKYNHIDSANVNGIQVLPEAIIDDSKESMQYYFCKNYLLKYKKVRARIAMGYYDPPKLNCN